MRGSSRRRADPPLSAGRAMSPGPVFAALVACLAGIAAGAAEDRPLAGRLAPHVGEPLDVVELNNGKRLVRPTLDGVTEKNGSVTALRLRLAGETKVTVIPLPGVTKIIAARETVYQGEPKGSGAAQLRSQAANKQQRQQTAASVERMRANGVEPWPSLSADEHALEVEKLRGFVGEVKELFPAMVSSETHEFLVLTDIPAAQMAPYVARLDAMHDFLCDLYGIPRGEPVWKGKCLAIAFLAEADFQAFEGKFFQLNRPGTHGLCHSFSDGRVVMACHRGDDAPAFAHMLVHETSHGFNHRWLSPRTLPSWLNEGIAEWVGTQVVPGSDQVPLKEAQALAYIQRNGSLGPGFFEATTIESIQYGMASALVKFLVSKDPKKFARFVRGIKEGQSVDESLAASFDASLDELVAAFGKAIGTPGLKK